jgi:hypothetical protein
VRPFADLAPELPVVVDIDHTVTARFGLTNVPMALWVEGGRIVRPAHNATVRRNRMRDQEVPEGLPDRMAAAMRAIKRIPDTADVYKDQMREWAAGGGVPGSGDVVGRSAGRTPEQAEALASFDLGRHLWQAGDKEGARAWWKRAHGLDPQNWASKRQAWTFDTTPEGATESDLSQDAQETYGTTWLDDIERLGPESYYPPLD